MCSLFDGSLGGSSSTVTVDEFKDVFLLNWFPLNFLFLDLLFLVLEEEPILSKQKIKNLYQNNIH